MSCCCLSSLGNANSTLLNDPDLFISRDGGVTWEETLKGSWGVSVADHGGLLVAARDYHQSRSNELLYSCDEGYSWLSFEFSTVSESLYISARTLAYIKSYNDTQSIRCHTTHAIDPLTTHPFS